MTKPQMSVLRETVFATLPKNVNIPKTDSVDDIIHVNIAWGKLPPDLKGNPVWLVHILGPKDLTNVVDAYEGKADIVAAVSGEEHTYAGESITVLDQMDIESIDTVTGTKDGDPKTFEEDVDFTVVDSDRDNALDGLQWLPGLAPDNGTDITVDYAQKLLKTERSHLMSARVTVNIITSPLKVGDAAKSPDAAGATRAYTASEIQEALHVALIQWFEQSRATFEGKEFSIGLQISADEAFSLQGSDLVQQHNEFEAMFQQDIALYQGPRVRKVTHETEVDIP